jgi:hypothetical protein
VYGARIAPTVQSDVTNDGGGVIASVSTAAAAFSLNNVRTFRATNIAIGAGSTVINQFGYACNSLSGATNNYGFYASSDAGVGVFNFYAAGTAANVFAGQTSIGGLVGSESLRITPVASAVNYLQIAGSASTTPTLSAQGSGADLDISLTPKGTGNVRFGAFTAGVLTPTGSITIKDAAGNTRRLLVG